MIRVITACILSGFIGSINFAQDPSLPNASVSPSQQSSLKAGGKIQVVDFDNDVMPVFTKLGCNAGNCHGAAVGRGGFKLSLYGGNTKADYEAIVQQTAGRRVNLAKPDKSLIFLKPAEYIEHGGGSRFDEQDEGAQILLSWIAQGAKAGAKRELKRVVVSPQKQVISKVGDSVSLRAVAQYSDSSTTEVTKWTVFQAEDDSAVDIDFDTGIATVLRRGRHVVVARFLKEVVPIELIVPMNDERIDLTAEPRNNFIDEEVFRSLTTLGLPVSPLTDDGTFLRRLTLDLTGRLPGPKMLDRFLANPDPTKRESALRSILDSKEFNEYWTLQLAKLFRIRPQVNEATGAHLYHEWFSKQLRDRTPFDVLCRTLILAEGDTTKNGPANFYRSTMGPRKQSELFSEVMMGSRVRCANCHNHPLDRWTQDDYHGLAAIFATIETGQFVKRKPGGKVIHPGTLEAAKQRIPGSRFLLKESDQGRKVLASWLTDEANPYFAKAIVNRLWKRMFGRGLVDPVDDFRSTNPATHPELLEKLAKDFVANGYDLRHTLKRIASSSTYARSANALSGNKDDDRFYSHALRRTLEPEVLADAISDVLGVAEKYGSQPLGTRAISLMDPKTKSASLDILGRCGRESSCETNSDAAGGLSQKLHFFNGSLLNERINNPNNRLGRMLKNGTSPTGIIDAFYKSALSRVPTGKERDFWKQQFDGKSSKNDQRQLLEDFLWGLLTSEEFASNH